MGFLFEEYIIISDMSINNYACKWYKKIQAVANIQASVWGNVLVSTPCPKYPRVAVQGFACFSFQLRLSCNLLRLTKLLCIFVNVLCSFSYVNLKSVLLLNVAYYHLMYDWNHQKAIFEKFVYSTSLRDEIPMDTPLYLMQNNSLIFMNNAQAQATQFSYWLQVVSPASFTNILWCWYIFLVC